MLSDDGRAGAERAAFEACIAAGGVAVFGADTVYGLACDPRSAPAVERLYALKGREPGKPAAIMCFTVARLLEVVPDLGPRTRALVRRLLPGGVTLLVPDPAGRFPLAGGGARLGLRVPAGGPLAGSRTVVLQSSANLAGEPAPRRLADVPAGIRAGADLVLDAGELPGTASTVVDLGAYETGGTWSIVRPGAVAETAVAAAAAGA